MEGYPRFLDPFARDASYRFRFHVDEDDDWLQVHPPWLTKKYRSSMYCTDVCMLFLDFSVIFFFFSCCGLCWSLYLVYLLLYTCLYILKNDYLL